ncbi:MAG TPA: hypothetical protein VJQ55_03845 [Candidatus Binatia bacterium]|nr:hypothetical protein [Candidatus Binatia bacterium]
MKGGQNKFRPARRNIPLARGERTFQAFTTGATALVTVKMRWLTSWRGI